jgi:hypothetical protein
VTFGRQMVHTSYIGEDEKKLKYYINRRPCQMHAGIETDGTWVIEGKYPHISRNEDLYKLGGVLQAVNKTNCKP